MEMEDTLLFQNYMLQNHSFDLPNFSDVLMEKMEVKQGTQDYINKRKPECNTEDDEGKLKRFRGKVKVKVGTSSSSEETSMEDSKLSETQKTDFIHVRVRRGQATDSHSLAERARREKISRKMKSLQELVPGCNKVIGKTGMLDEIINYVQSLQRQVEFLSMKLAALSSTMELNVDSVSGKNFLGHGAGFPVASMSMHEADSPHFSYSALHHLHEQATRAQLDFLNNFPEQCHDPLQQIQDLITWDNADLHDFNKVGGFH